MNGTYGHAQELNTHRNTGYSYPSSSTASSGLPHSTKSQGPTSTQPSRVASPVFNNPSRRGSANDAIHPYLQLPESISGSALGSLTEYTAQATCVFWFEDYNRLRQIEGGHSVGTLSNDARPATGFLKWVTTILSTTQVTQNVVLLALLFIRRLKNQNPSVKGKPGSEYRLLTVALMLGNKFLDDNTYTNKTWAEVSGISVGEIHVMEVEFLSHMKYNLYTSFEEWEHWHEQLAHLWRFFNPPSPVLPDMRLKQYGQRPPTIQIPRPLPSPPFSVHASSPLAMSISPGMPPYTRGPVLPHLAPPQLSPAQSLPGLDSAFSSRKRSWDDGTPTSVEPPAKRFYAQEQYRSRTSTPTKPLAHPDQLPRLPSLPMPNLSYPSSHTMQMPNYPTSHAPYIKEETPTRSLPPFNWSQSGIQHAHGLPPPHVQPHLAGPASRSSRQATPFSTDSAKASPVPPSYPSAAAHTTTQHQLSPSYFLHQRTSPYRPVRDISTLLFPSASGQIHSAQQEVSHHQMRWQPLGRHNERQSGRVPYLHRDAWPETHQYDQWPSMMPVNMRG